MGSSLGAKQTVYAHQIRPGDLTRLNGYRLVVATRAYGRNKIALTRSDGTADRMHRNDTLTVYRPADV